MRDSHWISAAIRAISEVCNPFTRAIRRNDKRSSAPIRGYDHDPVFALALAPRVGDPCPVRARYESGGVLLFLGKERRHFAAGAKGVHHLGSGRKDRDLHRAAEIRRQRSRFRHGDPDAEPAEAARDAARFLQASRGLHDHEEARVPHSKLLPYDRDSARASAAAADANSRREGRREPRGTKKPDGHRSRSRRRRFARLQDHRGRPGRRSLHTGSRTTSTATPATRRRSISTCRRSGSSRS